MIPAVTAVIMMLFAYCFAKGLVEELRRLFDKYMLKMLDFINTNCKQLVPIAELNGVASLCRLFDALGTTENGVSVRTFLISLSFLFNP